MFRKLAVLSSLLMLSFSAFAQTVTPAPELLNFQGKLTTPSGNPVADGTYSIRFSLYSALTNGTEKWFQTMNPVLVKNGTFAVLLGNGNPITADTLNGDTFLQIKVGNDAPLSPRQRIASVAYALKANTVPDGAITTTKIAEGAITSTKLSAGIGAFLGGVPSSYLILGYTPTAPTGYTFTGETLNNTNPWVTKTALPQGRRGRPARAALNGKIYVFGGNNNSVTTSTTYIYDSATSIWTTGTAMPTPRQAAAIAVLNGKIHLIGGSTPEGVAIASQDVYDPAMGVGGSWDSSKRALPVTTGQPSAVAYGNSIYLCGGWSGNGVATKKAYIYDGINDAWTPIADMNTERSFFGIALVDQSIYVMGGWNSN